MSVGEGLEFTIRRKVFTLFGAKFHIFNAAGEVIGFCKQKAFKLKEDLRIYTDESMSTEFLYIQARSIIDFGAAYDITDSRSGAQLGALRREGIKSMFRDSWQVLDAAENQIAMVQEDSTALALARRYLPLANLIPQTYHLVDGAGTQFAEMRTHFNPFIHRLTVTVSPTCTSPQMLILAAAILLVAIEGRQSN